MISNTIRQYKSLTEIHCIDILGKMFGDYLHDLEEIFAYNDDYLFFRRFEATVFNCQKLEFIYY